MKVKITFYFKSNKHDTVVIKSKIVDLPLKFGYGSYNEPRKVLGHFINVSDLISIEPVDS